MLMPKNHQNPLDFHEASVPEPSGTSQGICTGTLRNLTKHLLRRNHPEPHKVSAPEPSGTSQISQGICPGTLRNLITYLHLALPKRHQVAAPEFSGPHMTEKWRVHLSPSARAQMNTPFLAQHRLKMAPTWAPKSQHCPNMAPTRADFWVIWRLCWAI